MEILVIGGTVFLGRAIVDEAVSRGHAVTLFHRGLHGGDVHPELERITGDREGDLSALRGRRWDAVVDTCGFVPAVVGRLAAELADRVDHYVFISSVSVFRDWPERPIDDECPPLDCAADAGADAGEYGALKAGCERAVERWFSGRALHVRAGLIVGPHENIGRLPFWLRRMARGGEVLGPGRPDRELSLIDARDIAGFVVGAVERAVTGPHIVTSMPGQTTMAGLLELCRRATGSTAAVTWVPDDVVVAAGIEPWSELPLWIPLAEAPSIWHIDASKAHAAGLAPRPLVETISDTWAWMQSGVDDSDGYGSHRVVDLDPAREAAAIRG